MMWWLWAWLIGLVFICLLLWQAGRRRVSYGPTTQQCDREAAIVPLPEANALQRPIRSDGHE